MILLALPFAWLGVATAAEGSRIFTEDWVVKFPLKTFIMLIFVIGMVCALEKIFHSLRHLRNRHAAHIVTLALNELNTLGVLSLGMFIIQSLVHLDNETILLFEWAHIILFLMSISFLFFMGIFIWATTVYWREWKRAEVAVVDLISIAFAMRRSTRKGLTERYMRRWMSLALERRKSGHCVPAGYLRALPPVPGLCDAAIPASHRFTVDDSSGSDTDNQTTAAPATTVGQRSMKRAASVRSMAPVLDPTRLADLSQRLLATLSSHASREFLMTYAKFRLDMAAAMPGTIKSLTFVRYLAKCQRATFTDLFHIRMIAWLSILALGLFNSLRAISVVAATGIGAERWWDLLTFSLVQGYVPLVPYLCLWVFVYFSYNKMSHVGLASVRAQGIVTEQLGMQGSTKLTAGERLSHALSARTSDDAALLSLVEQLVDSASEQPRINWLKRHLRLESVHERGMRKLIESSTFDNKHFFVLGSRGLTLTILQVQLLLSVFYFASLLVSIGSQFAEPNPWWVHAIVIPVSALPIAIFVVTVPKTVQLLTVLSSTGTMLRTDILEEMAAKDTRIAQGGDSDSGSGSDGGHSGCGSGGGSAGGAPSTRHTLGGRIAGSSGSTESHSMAHSAAMVPIASLAPRPAAPPRPLSHPYAGLATSPPTTPTRVGGRAYASGAKDFTDVDVIPEPAPAVGHAPTPPRAPPPPRLSKSALHGLDPGSVDGGSDSGNTGSYGNPGSYECRAARPGALLVPPAGGSFEAYSRNGRGPHGLSSLANGTAQPRSFASSTTGNESLFGSARARAAAPSAVIPIASLPTRGALSDGCAPSYATRQSPSFAPSYRPSFDRPSHASGSLRPPSPQRGALYGSLSPSSSPAHQMVLDDDPAHDDARIVRPTSRRINYTAAALQ